MTEIQQKSAINQFISNKFASAANDGRITGREARELGQFIDNMQGLSDEDKNALKSMVNELEDSTNGRFLFFSWKKDISPNDMQDLKKLAKSNPLAQQLLEAFQSAAPASQPTIAQDSAQTPERGYPQAGFDPVQGQQQDQQGDSFWERLFRGGRTGATQGAAGTQEALPRVEGPAPAWGVGQNGTGLNSAGGDCGPASAAMVLKAFGIIPESTSSAEAIQMVRQAGNGVRNAPPYAMGEEQLFQAIERLSGGRVQNDSSITTGLVDSDAPGAYNTLSSAIQKSLAAGNMTMFLTGSPSSESRHYMIISHINENGNYVMVDPAGSNGQARVWEMTPAQMQQLMAEADSRGGSRVMSFARQ